MIEESKLPVLPGWDGPDKTPGGMYRWGKVIGYTHLIVRCFKDKVTGEYVTQGVLWDVSNLVGAPRWLIRDNRKFVLDFALVAPGDLMREDGDWTATTYGVGEVIEVDLSTPEKMADYLERLVL